MPLMTRMKHRDVQNTILVPKTATGNYVAAGWEVEEEDIDPTVTQPVEPPPGGLARIKHPGLDNREITVAAAAVPQYKESGWQLVEENPDIPAAPPPPENPEMPISVETAETVEPAPSGRRQSKEK